MRYFALVIGKKSYNIRIGGYKALNTAIAQLAKVTFNGVVINEHRIPVAVIHKGKVIK